MEWRVDGIGEGIAVCDVDLDVASRGKFGISVEKGWGLFRWAAVAILLALASATSVQASVIFDTTFLSSSSGTNTIEVGGSISFETFVTIDPGDPIAVIWILPTGDQAAAVEDPMAAHPKLIALEAKYARAGGPNRSPVPDEALLILLDESKKPEDIKRANAIRWVIIDRYAIEEHWKRAKMVVDRGELPP